MLIKQKWIRGVKTLVENGTLRERIKEIQERGKKGTRK